MPTPTYDAWQRPGPTARQRRIDLYIGLATAAAAVLNVVMVRSMGLFFFGTTPSAPEQYAWALAVTLPLIWRRSHPEVVLLVVAAVFIAGQVRGSQEIQLASGAIFAAIYALGVIRPEVTTKDTSLSTCRSPKLRLTASTFSTSVRVPR